MFFRIEMEPAEIYRFATLKLTTPLQTNMDTQDDGLENASPFEYGHIWPFLVSMLNFCFFL